MAIIVSQIWENMSNEGFDPCEIVWGQWNHELSMRRLLNVVCIYRNYLQV